MFKFIETEISSMMYDEIESIKKILIVGLENAGKTSLVKSILYEFESLMALAPSIKEKSSEIMFLGHKINIIDIGGKNRYEKDYFRNPDRYFKSINYLYYIIDIQDKKKIRESMAYFLKIIDILYENSPNVQVFIFFHKYDSNLSNKIRKRFDISENQFLSEILPKIQKKRIFPTIFHTTLKNPDSIVTRFTQPLLSNDYIYETLSKTIKHFCIEEKIEFAVLFINNIEIGHYYPTLETLKKINKTTMGLFQKYRETSIKKGKNFTSYNESQKIEINVTKFEIEIGNINFVFFFTLGFNPSISEIRKKRITKDSSEFTKHLQKILINSEIIRTGELRVNNIQKN